MNPLKINVTGVRGVVGETFTPHLVTNFAQAFGAYTGGGRVFVCNDARRSAPMAISAVMSGLLSSGCAPVDFGICPTPSMQFALSRASRPAGGIAISAGHNPEDWNALRFLRPDGMYLNSRQAEELLDILHSGEFTKAHWDEIRKTEKARAPLSAHIDAIVSAFDAAKIRKRGLRIAVDTCNGACSEAAPRLLESLGCKVVCIHDQPGKAFPHNPEPSVENMQTLRAIVVAAECDAGFMLDSAGERLGIVTEDGSAVPEDYTLALCASLLKGGGGGAVVVTNLSTTRAIDDIARAAGGKVLRTLTGQAYVSEAAMKNSAVIAGEGSGGVVIPAVQYNNDSLAAMAFILHHIAKTRTRLSKAASALPAYIMKKKNIPQPPDRIFTAIQKARAAASHNFSNARVNFDDGIKIDWTDSWLHIRPSNTESIIRVIAEAKTAQRAAKLLDTGCSMVQ